MSNVAIKKAFFMAFALLLSAGAARAGKTDFTTLCERSGYARTSRYGETVEFCRELAEAYPSLEYTAFGKSARGLDLPLLIFDAKGHFTAPDVRGAGNAVILIQAGIHPGEISGKDAGLILMRDIAMKGELKNSLENLTILFIPVFNVDGFERFGPYNRINQNGPEEMGWRTNAQNLNLNRDYLKADSPEMRAWLKLFNDWLPEFFVDCHATDGADYQYALTYGLELHGNMEEGLTAWTRGVFLPFVEKGMEERGFPISPYVILKRRHDVRSGLVSWVAPPALSEGYTALQNRPGLLIETHMMKDYRTRVESTREMLRQTILVLGDQIPVIRRLVLSADRYAESGGLCGPPFPLTFRSTADSVMMDFLGVEYEEIDSDLSGGRWFRFGEKPVTFKIPYFNRQEPDIEVELPYAYIVPPEWTAVIDRLDCHGIDYFRLTCPESLTVRSCRFSDVSWSETPREGRHPLKFKTAEVIEDRIYPRGSAVVFMNQRAARVAAHIFEPEAPFSLVAWGFFDAIFERKEYYESYVMEEMARKMLDEDEDLKREFDKLVENDPEFAGNPRSILNWFYMRSPYWDAEKDLYPVGRIFDPAVLDRLLRDHSSRYRKS